MAEKLLHPNDRYPSLRGMYGERMPRIVRPRSRDASCPAGRVPHVSDDAVPLELVSENDVVGPRGDTRQVLPESALQGPGDR